MAYNFRLDYLYHALEMAEQDLLDHDGAEVNAPERIAKIKEQIALLNEPLDATKMEGANGDR